MAESDQLPAETRPTNRSSSRPQLLLNLLARFDQQALRLFQSSKQSEGAGGVAPVTLEVSDNLTLLLNVVFAGFDTLLNLPETIFDPCPFHWKFLPRALPSSP